MDWPVQVAYAHHHQHAVPAEVQIRFESLHRQRHFYPVLEPRMPLLFSTVFSKIVYTLKCQKHQGAAKCISLRDTSALLTFFESHLIVVGLTLEVNNILTILERIGGVLVY